MSRLKATTWIYLAAGLLLAVLLGELWWLGNRRAAAQGLERQVNQAAARLHAFGTLSPAPTREVAARWEAEVATAEEALAGLRGRFAGGGARAEAVRLAVPPVQRADAFFDIARFVEAQRLAARQAGVALRAEDFFGFVTHAQAGPAPEHIARVHRQRLIAAHLLEALWAARPARFDGLERARPEGGAPAAMTGRAADANDFFVIDPQVSARREGLVHTEPMRVRFSGQTTALRAFLNRLADYELPLLVRSVEVEPAPDLNRKAPGASGRAEDPFAGIFGSVSDDTPRPEAPVPLVAENFSRFTITVEYVELRDGVAEKEAAW
jgi:hypothetical protein